MNGLNLFERGGGDWTRRVSPHGWDAVGFDGEWLATGLVLERQTKTSVRNLWLALFRRQNERWAEVARTRVLAPPLAVKHYKKVRIHLELTALHIEGRWLIAMVKATADWYAHVPGLSRNARTTSAVAVYEIIGGPPAASR